MNRHRRSDRVSMGGWNRLLVVALGILLVSWSGPAASAFWSSVSSNGAAAKSDSLAQGSKPSTSVTGTNVSVTWAASTTAAGRAVTGYSIARYGSATGGTRVPATGACAGTVTSLACVEANVPAGTWYYTVTPMLALWQGQESARSTGTTPVTDTTPPAAPKIMAPSAINSLNDNGVQISGTAEANSSITLTVSGSGSEPITRTFTTNSAGSWTAPALDLRQFADGIITHSARATDATGNISAPGIASTTKESTPPRVVNLQLFNGSSGVAGLIEKGDYVEITFSKQLKASTLCSTWTSDTAKQTLNGNGQVTARVRLDDVLTVSTTACTLQLGAIALGKDYATTAALVFSGNGSGSGNVTVLSWDPAELKLTLTLGARSGIPNSVELDPAVATFVPASGLTDGAGNPVESGSATWATSRF